MVTRSALEELVREARARTGVPGVAAGIWSDGSASVVADGVLSLGGLEPVRAGTPFRIASVSKPFTASLAVAAGALDERLGDLLGHTAGLCPESGTPLPEAASGLFSYSNAGYREAGEAAARAAGLPFAEAMRERVLAPLELAATGYEEPAAPARGHVQEGETGHRPVLVDAYPAARRPSGGLWSTAGDLLRFAAHHLGATAGPLSAEQRETMRRPRSAALGGGYGLGWWTRGCVFEGRRGRSAVDHEGSVAGYQSLLLLVPEEAFALAVLTNSWRGSGLVRRVVEALGIEPAPARDGGAAGVRPQDVSGRYELENGSATVTPCGDGVRVEDVELDPVTGARAATRFEARRIGGDVFGLARGVLMGYRVDFPRPGVARIGWVARPRAEW